MAPETAGDPRRAQTWLRSSLRSLSARLAQVGHRVSVPTMERLLNKHEHALRANAKKKEAGAQHPERDVQCHYRDSQKQVLMAVRMRKIEIVNRIAAETGLTQVKAEEAVDAILEEIKDGLQRGEPVTLRRFGSLQVREKRARMGRNPNTGEEARIPAHRWWARIIALPQLSLSRRFRRAVFDSILRISYGPTPQIHRL